MIRDSGNVVKGMELVDTSGTKRFEEAFYANRSVLLPGSSVERRFVRRDTRT